MRFLVDAQLPPGLCAGIGQRGFEAVHITEVLGGQAADAQVAAHAIAYTFVLVTKDDDFALRHPPIDYQLVWLRCGNITNRALRHWLEDRWQALVERLEAGDRLIELR